MEFHILTQFETLATPHSRTMWQTSRKAGKHLDCRGMTCREKGVRALDWLPQCAQIPLLTLISKCVCLSFIRRPWAGKHRFNSLQSFCNAQTGYDFQNHLPSLLCNWKQEAQRSNDQGLLPASISSTMASIYSTVSCFEMSRTIPTNTLIYDTPSCTYQTKRKEINK